MHILTQDHGLSSLPSLLTQLILHPESRHRVRRRHPRDDETAGSEVISVTDSEVSTIRGGGVVSPSVGVTREETERGTLTNMTSKHLDTINPIQISESFRN